MNFSPGGFSFSVLAPDGLPKAGKVAILFLQVTLLGQLYDVAVQAEILLELPNFPGRIRPFLFFHRCENPTTTLTVSLYNCFLSAHILRHEDPLARPARASILLHTPSDCAGWEHNCRCEKRQSEHYKLFDLHRGVQHAQLDLFDPRDRE